MASQLTRAAFAVKVDRELALSASAVAAVPECMPIDALDLSLAFAFAADIPAHADDAGGVVATFAVAPP